MYCCWPHQPRVPFLRSAPHPPRYEAPPGKPPYGTVLQSRTRTGTANARCKTHLAAWCVQVNPCICTTRSHFLYLFILLILKWDFGSAWLPHSWAVVGSFLVSWRETQSTFTSLPQEVTHSLSSQIPSCCVSLRRWGWGSEPYLIWPEPPLGGSPSLPPSRWRWPRGGRGEPGTAGYSGKQKPWIGSRVGQRND